MKKVTLFFAALVFSFLFYACGGNTPAGQTSTGNESAEEPENEGSENPSYDPNRGVGKFTTLELSEHLDVTKADGGKKVYDVKCSSCHKLTDEKLVGPGWKGVTTRRKPVWIMNFITNTDAMIDKDPEAQAQLEICLVRMPNQSLSDDDARNLLEFMRKNDGVK